MRGSIYKRCSCPIERDARGNRKACKLRHGSWTFVVDLGAGRGKDGVWQERRQVKRSGFPTKDAAADALAQITSTVADGSYAHDEQMTVGAFLEQWVAAKEANGLRPTTVQSYRQHIRDYLVPYLGQMRLRDLRPGHVEHALVQIAQPVKGRRAMGPATVRRVHATLRSALATAKRKRLISHNPAVDVDLPSASRPKVHPWQPGELGAFLDHAAHDRLGVLFEVMAAAGLRRGEALGLRWEDVDLERRVLVVRQQVVQLAAAAPCGVCGQTHNRLAFGRPKTASGESRGIDFDGRTAGALMEHRLRQDSERAAWSGAYSDHGLVFAREDGTPINPDYVSHRFVELVAEAGLRRVRLHDLRHGAASLMLAAGVDIAIVSKRLGHSNISITADTYSHLLEGWAGTLPSGPLRWSRGRRVTTL
ncbi:site-specific integrase [Cellulomonas sp. ATA003]|uniref:tyrosine-type recombinase/integrase n=1 Tax=Cellulomonas sp. ATA003 TaxID=3073064 RepID=UPI0028734C5E|nr:site-specific integrase [Cellulomonas sp. ATA003]WNB84520.1 site-specific integrase [Cellulomonas sp. ATA003]